GLDFIQKAAPLAVARPSSTIPAALAGWFQGNGASVPYYDPSTGAWAPPTGSGFRYTFGPAGAYEYSGLLQTTSYPDSRITQYFQSDRRGPEDVND
ncbi:MAG: hypothetical protein WD314_02575, partial [Trueperaceae bacterium]